MKETITLLNHQLRDCQLRRATVQDIWSIRRLVFLARLDPTQLRWSQFWVICKDEKIIGCGQLRTFRGAQELGSVVIEPAWRRCGLGTYLVQHLAQEASEPLYLECLGIRLAQFYTRNGFVSVDWHSLPPSLKRKFGFSTLVAKLLRLPLHLMQYRAVTAGLE